MKKRIYICTLLIMHVFTSVNAQTSLSLLECKNLAIKNNAKIKNAQLEVDASKQTKDAAYTKYFPQVSASFMGMYALKDLVEIETSGGNLPVYDGNPANLANATQFAYMPASKMSLLDNLLVGSISIMQPIYAGGRIETGNKLAELGKDINNDKLNIEKYNVYQKTEEIYRNILSLQEKVKTIDFYETFLNKLLKDVNISYEAGLISKNDVLKVSLKLNELKINRLKLQNGIDLLKEALCQHMGIAFENNIKLSDTIVEIIEPAKFYLEANSALSNRFEMNMLKNAVKAKEYQTDLKRGEYLPEIAIGSMLFGVNVMDKTTFNGMFFASVSVPISGWWEASHLMEERKLKEEIIKNTEKETSELLTLQISKAWKDLNETYKQIELGNDMNAQAQENFKINQSNYNAGVNSISDFLEAQAAVQLSEDQLIEFKNNYAFAVTKYLQAIGKY